MNLNEPELELADLIYAYQTWVMAVINDEKLDSEEQLMTDEIETNGINSMRFLSSDVTNAIETSLARVYSIDAEELSLLLFPED